MASVAEELVREVERRRHEIRSESYPMSIGEVVNLYTSGELNIHPEFQRFYRWGDDQKSYLIESILLGIPLPQFFVSQRQDGVWEVIDGLQRLSTIFEFMGILKNVEGNNVPPLQLTRTKYLPSLENMYYDNSNDTDHSIDQSLRLVFKRTKLNFSIVLRESTGTAKYELFQRLNTRGASLTDQEVRNCVLLMEQPRLFEVIAGLAENDDFLECVALPERGLLERYNVELANRFFALYDIDVDSMGRINEINSFVTDVTLGLKSQTDAELDERKSTFVDTFSFLNAQLGDSTFRKYDRNKQRFVGGFSVSAFEVVAFGVAYNKAFSLSSEQLKNKVVTLWNSQEFKKSSGTGVSTRNRIPKLIRYGRKLFAKAS